MPSRCCRRQTHGIRSYLTPPQSAVGPAISCVEGSGAMPKIIKLVPRPVVVSIEKYRPFHSTRARVSGLESSEQCAIGRRRAREKERRKKKNRIYISVSRRPHQKFVCKKKSPLTIPQGSIPPQQQFRPFYSDPLRRVFRLAVPTTIRD
jgi:hypothetical protein